MDWVISGGKQPVLDSIGSYSAKLPSFRQMLERGDRLVGIKFNVTRGPMAVDLEKSLFYQNPNFPGFTFTIEADVLIKVVVHQIDLSHQPEIRLQGIVKRPHSLHFFTMTYSVTTYQGLIEFLD